MKKYFVLIVIVLLMCGCGKNESSVKEVDYSSDIEAMRNKLIEYGKLIYENDVWIKGNVEPGVYFMTLTDMSEHNGYDISMFVNPKTKEVCDPILTRIEFIVSDKTTTEKTDYEFHPVLSCNLDIDE